MPDHSFIKEKYRQPSGVETFAGLVFRRAPITKVQLTREQRLEALAGLFDPRSWFWNLRHEFGRRVAEFRTGWSYRVSVK